MSNRIDYISVKNNEILSSNLILKSIKKRDIILIHKESINLNKLLIPIEIKGPAVILQSSGSSKKPKLCIHSISNLTQSAQSSGIWLKEQGFNLEECFIFNTLPLFHISGFMPLWRSQIWACDYINISPNLIKRTNDLINFSLSLNIHKKKLITSLVPTQIFRLLQEKNGLDWLRMFDLIWVGGAIMSNNLFDTCKKEKINLAPCYGTTETAAMISSLKPEEFLEGNKSYGGILKDVQIRINKEGIIEVKTDRIGLELERSSNIKYFRNNSGWWESGDYGKLIKIKNGKYLTVIGRKDNAFQSGGETVFPDLINNRVNEFIFDKKLPIHNFTISKKEDPLWGNRFEIILNFENHLSQSDIKKSINLLNDLSKKWPNHERPTGWVIRKGNNKFIKSTRNNWKINF